MLINFSKFSSVKIGGIFEVKIIEENSDFKGTIIGGANNILISQNPGNLGILSDKFKYIFIDKDGFLNIGAKTKSSEIYNFAKKNNLANFEFLKNIPGTLGGLLSMNAGLMNYEISNNLISLKTNFGEFQKNELKFSYRKSEIFGIIFEAKFKILKGFDENLSQEISQKRKNQPRGASFGSCFKNPKNFSAGKLLQDCDLKGYKIGNCGFSEIHANFLINYGDGKFEEAIKLINLAKKRVFEKFGINLECEVKIL